MVSSSHGPGDKEGRVITSKNLPHCHATLFVDVTMAKIDDSKTPRLLAGPLKMGKYLVKWIGCLLSCLLSPGGGGADKSTPPPICQPGDRESFLDFSFNFEDSKFLGAETMNIAAVQTEL